MGKKKNNEKSQRIMQRKKLGISILDLTDFPKFTSFTDPKDFESSTPHNYHLIIYFLIGFGSQLT